MEVVGTGIGLMGLLCNFLAAREHLTIEKWIASAEYRKTDFDMAGATYGYNKIVLLNTGSKNAYLDDIQLRIEYLAGQYRVVQALGDYVGTEIKPGQRKEYLLGDFTSLVGGDNPLDDYFDKLTVKRSFIQVSTTRKLYQLPINIYLLWETIDNFKKNDIICT